MIKPAPSDSLKDKLSEMAISLADEAMLKTGADEVPLDQRIACFRALSAYYAMINKIDPGEGEKGAYDGYRSKIESASGGRTARNGAGRS